MYLAEDRVSSLSPKSSFFVVSSLNDTRRFCAGNSSRNEAGLGSCIMSSRRMRRLMVPDAVSLLVFRRSRDTAWCSLTSPLPRFPELVSQRRRWLNGSFFAVRRSLLRTPGLLVINLALSLSSRPSTVPSNSPTSTGARISSFGNSGSTLRWCTRRSI